MLLFFKKKKQKNKQTKYNGPFQYGQYLIFIIIQTEL